MNTEFDYTYGVSEKDNDDVFLRSIGSPMFRISLESTVTELASLHISSEPDSVPSEDPRSLLQTRGNSLDSANFVELDRTSSNSKFANGSPAALSTQRTDVEARDCAASFLSPEPFRAGRRPL